MRQSDFRVSNIPELVVGGETTEFNKTGSWRNIRPIFEEGTGPCRSACPLKNNIPATMDLVRQGKFEEAALLWQETNPFPAITGRVCPHPCEVGCNRKRLDEPIAIREVERFLGDYLQSLPVHPPETSQNSRVIVVGSGPAGMSCAFFLRKMGYQVQMLEQYAQLGGVLRYGIPSYRLPHHVLDREFERLNALGVKMETGRKVTYADVQGKADAVFFATGAHKEVFLHIPGEEHLVSGIEFLRNAKTGIFPKEWRKVGVIGGGNVAMDVARTLKRMGAEPVVFYRRTEKEMPALKEEIEKLHEDGIPIEFLVAPVGATRILNQVVLRLIRMRLGEKDASGRPRPIPIEGSEFDVSLDAVIRAAGERADTGIFPPEVLDKNGWLVVDEKTAATAIPGLFAGGDVVTGPATVVDAFAWGRKAALNIHRFLQGLPLQPEPPIPKTVPYTRIRMDYFLKSSRVEPPSLPPSERIHSWAEEIQTFSAEQVIQEAQRCFVCGVCNGCGVCWIFCPDVAISLDSHKPSFLYDFCKGCGICSVECPRGIIRMIPEMGG
ncbi:MAG: FAD-dependent oxidoreductase [bacterium JZ-2024 1]